MVAALGFDDCRPALGMVAVQFAYAGVSLLSRTVILQGMSPRVFVVYSKAIAALFIAPIAYFSSKNSDGASMGLKSFSLIFLASLIGISVSQNLFFEGLYLASSSLGSAMGNLTPAITFLMAFLLGLEKINVRSLRSIAKIAGTLICVTGAISMALLRGPKLLNGSSSESFLGLASENNWLLGSLFLFGSTCCWSFWLIIQIPVTTSYPDHLSLSAWTCFLASIQCAIYTFFVESDMNAWRFHSYLEIFVCLYSGTVGCGLSFFIQAWCISQKGPLFSAMFSPLCTVIVTVLAAVFLHEEIYIGGLLGAVGVIFGLYVVLWGKSIDFIENEEEIDRTLKIDRAQTVIIVAEESTDEGCKIDLKEPLLADKSRHNQV